jgi:hypothetical protein
MVSEKVYDIPLVVLKQPNHDHVNQGVYLSMEMYTDHTLTNHTATPPSIYTTASNLRNF